MVDHAKFKHNFMVDHAKLRHNFMVDHAKIRYLSNRFLCCRFQNFNQHTIHQWSGWSQFQTVGQRIHFSLICYLFTFFFTFSLFIDMLCFHLFWWSDQLLLGKDYSSCRRLFVSCLDLLSSLIALDSRFKFCLFSTFNPVPDCRNKIIKIRQMYFKNQTNPC